MASTGNKRASFNDDRLMDKVSDSSVGGNQVLVNVEVHREQDDNSDSDVQSGQVNFQLCDENDSQENSLFSYFDMSNDDIDNDDAIEAKSPVLKSKRDKNLTKRQSFIYDYDKIKENES